MGLWERLAGLGQRAGGTAPPDAPKLRREVAAKILELGAHGRLGEPTFPPAVRVAIVATPGQTGVVTAFVDDPAFDHDVDTELRNRLAGTPALPHRIYVVEEGEPVGVVVSEAASFVLGRLRVVSTGDMVELHAGRELWRLGRGDHHGEDGPNDVRLDESFVSRRAAVLRRAGVAWEVETRDQKAALYVLRRDGSRVHPAKVPSNRARMTPGEHLVFTDGKDKELALKLEGSA